jgi:hypothetical protein
VSSPTRPPGANKVSFDASGSPLKDLKPGAYRLMVEASREVGGKELVEVPFQWGPGAESTQSAAGREELGAVTLKVVK